MQPIKKNSGKTINRNGRYTHFALVAAKQGFISFKGAYIHKINISNC